MRKWKRDYLLNNNPMDKISWKSDKGFTLVELLASIALLSVVILLAGSVHIFGQRQFISQTESASQANDMSYALSVMSRDLRKEAYGDIEIFEENGGDFRIEVKKVMTFKMSGQNLYKKKTLLSSSVKMDLPQKNDDDKSLEILLKSSSSNSQIKTYQTTIYFRR